MASGIEPRPTRGRKYGEDSAKGSPQQERANLGSGTRTVETPVIAPAPAAPPKRAEGVIGTIKAMIDTKGGATQAEILDALVQKFPRRTRDGMSSTVRIQCSRLAKSTGRAIISKDIEGRGRVY